MSIRNPSPTTTLGLGLLLSTAALTSTAHAQCLNPNLGIGLNPGDDQVVVCASLGFAFPFPNGQSVTSLAVDTNGRIFPVNGDTSDFSDTVAELLSGPTALCPFWEDINPAASGDVHCFSDGVDTAVITWHDVVRFGQTNPFTFQAELHADGSFRFVYDERMRNSTFTSSIVGYTVGGGTADPGPSDWSSTLFSGPIDSGTTDTGYDTGPFDLSGTALDFVPNGGGGYTVTASLCGFAFAAVTGESCANRRPTSLRFTNSLFGWFIATPGAVPFDTNSGISMGHGDDTVIPASLGFQLRMPGGTHVDTIDVSANGRIFELGGGTPDFTPSTAEVVNHPTGHFNPFWCDLSPNLGGDVRFYTNGIDLATVTWIDVPQFGLGNALTVQVQMRRLSTITSSFTVVFEDTGEFDPSRLIIGTGAGAGAPDPGEVDLSAGVSATAVNTYEYFNPAINDVFDLQPITASPTLEFSTHPILGGTFELTLDGMAPNNLGSFVMIGFSNVNADLSVLGMNCTLYSDNAIPAIQIGAAGDTSATWSLLITSLDIPLVLQGAVIEPGINPLGVDLTAAVEAFTGL